jgi:hypothetical protein
MFVAWTLAQALVVAVRVLSELFVCADCLTLVRSASTAKHAGSVLYSNFVFFDDDRKPWWLWGDHTSHALLKSTARPFAAV